MRSASYRLFNIALRISLVVCINPCLIEGASLAGASFLKIAPGSRAAGMGGAFTAYADDATAVWWNPGGLAQLQKREITGMHAEWLAGMQYDFTSYAHPTSFGTFSGSMAFLNSGSIESRDENRNKTADFAARDTTVSFGYAYRPFALLSAGFQLKLIRQEIASVKAQGYAIDYGSIIHLPVRGVHLGLGVFNIGPMMKFTDVSFHLPLRYSIGLGYMLGSMRLALDVRHEHYENTTHYALGSEYALFNTMSLRLGYMHAPLRGYTGAARDTNNNGSGFTGIRGGFGLALFGYQMDYAMVPFGQLGSTHHISFTSRF